MLFTRFILLIPPLFGVIVAICDKKRKGFSCIALKTVYQVNKILFEIEIEGFV